MNLSLLVLVALTAAFHEGFTVASNRWAPAGRELWRHGQMFGFAAHSAVLAAFLASALLADSPLEISGFGMSWFLGLVAVLLFQAWATHEYENGDARSEPGSDGSGITRGKVGMLLVAAAFAVWLWDGAQWPPAWLADLLSLVKPVPILPILPHGPAQ